MGRRELTDSLFDLPGGDGALDVIIDEIGFATQSSITDLLALPGPRHVDQEVSLDGVEPGPQRTAGGIEPVTGTPSTCEGLLHGLLGQMGTPQGSASQTGQLGPIGGVGILESLLVRR